MTPTTRYIIEERPSTTHPHSTAKVPNRATSIECSKTTPWVALMMNRAAA